MRPSPGLSARLALAFLLVMTATLVTVLVALERVTTESFGDYVRHVEMMRSMMGGGELMPDADAFVTRLRWSLLLGGLGGAAVALLLSMVISRHLTGPLRELRDATRDVAAGDTAVRVPQRTTDEVGDLAAGFNAMAQALEDTSTARRRFMADVAHELRTPLAVLQAELEALQDGVLEPDPERFAALTEETRLLARIVEDLGTLSLADAGALRLEFTEQPLEPLVRRPVAAMAEPAAATGVRLEVQSLPDLLVRADGDRVDQVLRNLLSNAIRHTPPGGTVTLSARRAGDRVRVSVDDTGPGVDPAALPRLFERFYRPDRSRSRQSGGTGLGLAIVRELVQAHDGEVAAANRPEGGARFSFTLPLAAVPDARLRGHRIANDVERAGTRSR